MSILTHIYSKACRRTSWRPNLCFLECTHLRWAPEDNEYRCNAGHMGGFDEIKVDARVGKWYGKQVIKNAERKADNR